MASIYCRHRTAPETLNAIAHAVQESSGTAYLADTAFRMTTPRDSQRFSTDPQTTPN